MKTFKILRGNLIDKAKREEHVFPHFSNLLMFSPIQHKEHRSQGAC